MDRCLGHAPLNILIDKWPTTTRHLRVLEAAGLVRQERRGRTRVYTVDKTRLALVSEWLGWFSLDAGTPVPAGP